MINTPELSDHNAIKLEVISEIETRQFLTSPILIKDHVKIKRLAIKILKLFLHQKFNVNYATNKL